MHFSIFIVAELLSFCVVKCLYMCACVGVVLGIYEMSLGCTYVLNKSLYDMTQVLHTNKTVEGMYF